MRRRISVGWQIFLGILTVALGAVLAVGLVTRRVVTGAVGEYVTRMNPTVARPRMMGRALLGAAEQSFIDGVNRGVLVGAVISFGIAAAAAFFIARYLTRPLRSLETAAEELAGGDLTHRVELEGPAEVVALGEAFNAMADSLEEAEDLRRRMVADVAHELRNPIAAIRAQVDGMAEGVLPADAARLGSVSEDVAHLSALVDDLQVLAVAEAGRLAYDMGPVDLADLCEREAHRASASAREGVTVDAHTSGPTLVDADERRLSEVLRNLLGNAVRHTERGSVSVTVSTVATGWGTVAEVRVSDTGEGISEDDLPYIFERFYRADSSRAAATGGSGLGLSISRRIIEDHGGEMFAESVAGEGTTIGFRLPLA